MLLKNKGVEYTQIEETNGSDHRSTSSRTKDRIERMKNQSFLRSKTDVYTIGSSNIGVCLPLKLKTVDHTARIKVNGNLIKVVGRNIC